MRHLKTSLLMLLLTAGMITVFLPNLLAVPATTMSVNPSHAAEGASVAINLALSDYTPSAQYSFTVNVTDPLGANSTRAKSVTIGSNRNAALSFSYPSEFTPIPNTHLNGTYAVRIVTSTAPSGVPSAPVYFTVGPADRTLYQRTMTVNILTRGYEPNNQTTVNVTFGGLPVSGFPRVRTASSTGVVSDSWSIPVNAALGSYVVSVAGNSTKPPSAVDSQTVRIIPAVLTFRSLSAARVSGTPLASLLRGNTAFAVFNVTYPNGTIVSAPSTVSSVEFLNPSNTPVSTLAAGYNATQRQYITSSGYTFSISAPTGLWTLRLIANTTADAYGNQGPFNNMTQTFTLNRLALITSITALKNSYNRTVTFGVNATVSYPTADPFTASSGVVSANLTAGARQEKRDLTYNGATSKWQGNLTIPPDYPLGIATLQISARDNFGNTGTNQAFTITVTPTSLIIRQLNVNATEFKAFQTVRLELNATYPNNQTLILAQGGGQLSFQLPNGRVIIIQTTLQGGLLRGDYKILDTDPLGEWNLTIRARLLNDGNGNLNDKAFAGAIIKINPILLAFDSQLITAPGGIIVTGDEFTLAVAFRYPGTADLQNWSPNADLVANLKVNATVTVGGNRVDITSFVYNSALMKYVATIDTSGWSAGTYELRVFASVAAYQGTEVIQITVEPTPFLVGPIVGALLIAIILGIAFFEYSRRRGVETESE